MSVSTWLPLDLRGELPVRRGPHRRAGTVDGLRGPGAQGLEEKPSKEDQRGKEVSIPGSTGTLTRPVQAPKPSPTINPQQQARVVENQVTGTGPSLAPPGLPPPYDHAAPGRSTG